MSKRLCAKRDCDFINERVLELAQIFAPPQFEFPMDLLPSSSIVALTPPVENLDVVEIVSVSKEENAAEENFVPLQSQLENNENPPRDGIAEGMEVDPSLRPEEDIECNTPIQ